MSRLALVLVLAPAWLLALAACVRSSPTPAASEPSAESPVVQTVIEPKPARELALVPAVEPEPSLAPLSSFVGSPVSSETRDNGLEVLDYRAGEGLAAEMGDYLEVHYVLTLEGGVVIDSSHDREPFKAVLGETALIPGFALGLVGAQRGMLRKLIVPPALGYGDREVPGIPPQSTLIFHIQVMTVSDW